jgi:hypothetical protein
MYTSTPPQKKAIAAVDVCKMSIASQMYSLREEMASAQWAGATEVYIDFLQDSITFAESISTSRWPKAFFLRATYFSTFSYNALLPVCITHARHNTAPRRPNTAYNMLRLFKELSVVVDLTSTDPSVLEDLICVSDLVFHILNPHGHLVQMLLEGIYSLFDRNGMWNMPCNELIVQKVYKWGCGSKWHDALTQAACRFPFTSSFSILVAPVFADLVQKGSHSEDTRVLMVSALVVNSADSWAKTFMLYKNVLRPYMDAHYGGRHKGDELEEWVLLLLHHLSPFLVEEDMEWVRGAPILQEDLKTISEGRKYAWTHAPPSLRFANFAMCGHTMREE